MQEFKEINIGGISFDIFENKNNITLRIINKGKPIQTEIGESRYISTKRGILLLDSCNPFEMKYSGILISENSFLDTELDFQQGNISNGDRLELKVSNITDLILVRQNNSWLVLEEHSKERIKIELDSKIEHYEAIEEKIGLSLQNFSVNVIDNNTISLFCEVFSDSKGPKNSFAIEVAVYDKNCKIVSYSNIIKNKEDFLGFEVFSFREMSLPIPIYEIGKIVFYPTVL